MKKLDPARRMERLKIQLLQHSPFFGRIACELKWIEDEQIPTAGTDGRIILFGKKYLEELDEPKALFVSSHEVMHVALKHHLRRKDRQPQIWNMACDFVVNKILMDCKVGTAPDKILIDTKRRFDGMTEEQIYEILKQEVKIIEITVSDPGGCGEVMDSPALGEGESAIADENNKINRVVEAAAQAAKQAGKLPGPLEDFANQNLKPQVNWKAQLRRFVMPLFPTDTRWEHPNRRMIHSGMYIPGVIKDGTGPIALGMDTSGSISNEELQVFFAECFSIFKDTSPDMLFIFWFNAHVWRMDEIPRGSFLEFPSKIESGGTSFQSVFDEIESRGISPRCLIMLTDMYNSFPEMPNFPVIWCATSEIEAPYGHTIKVGIHAKN